jgi:hypothetical protein
MSILYRILRRLTSVAAVMFAITLYGEFGTYAKAGWHLSDVQPGSEPVLVALFAAAPAVVLFTLARLVKPRGVVS